MARWLAPRMECVSPPSSDRNEVAFSETPQKKSRGVSIRTPMLHGLDSSSASIDSFKPQQEPGHGRLRPFVQGSVDGDIFGTRLPPTRSSSDRPENKPFSQQAYLDSSDLMDDHMASHAENDDSILPPQSPAKRTPGWIRTGQPMPLGQMRMEDPRASLDLDSTFDINASIDPFNSRDIPQNEWKRRKVSADSDSSSSRQISREWPPSPKKSPIKRKLQFQQPPQLGQSTPAAGPHLKADELDHDHDEESFLADLHNRRQPTKLHDPFVAADEQAKELHDFSHITARPQPRQRRSLMRRRKPTQVHEDPASPQVDTLSGEKESNASEQSSEDESAPTLAGHGQWSFGRGLVDADTPNRAEVRRRGKIEEKLWTACGGNVERWNRGDFGDGSGLGLANVRW